MHRRSLWSIALLGAAALLGVAAGGAGDGAGDGAPRVRAFSPASVHPGDEFLVDADFAGRGTPRVWVGAYRVPRSRLRLDANGGADGARRVWGRVPRLVPAGDQFLKIATRDGAAFAAKPIQVASCTGAPPAAGCDVIPGIAVNATVTGSGGYSFPIQLASAPSFAAEPSDPAESYLAVCGDDGKFRCLTIRVTTMDLAEIHVGTLPTLGLHYYDGQTGNQWVKEPGSAVKVVSASPTEVVLCLDATLPFNGHVSGSTPATVSLKGYLVFTR